MSAEYVVKKVAGSGLRSVGPDMRMPVEAPSTRNVPGY